MPDDRVLLDANILVYSFDSRFPERQRTAREAIQALTTANTAIISPQTVGEFFRVMTSKQELAAFLPRPDAIAQALDYLKLWPVLPITTDVVRVALLGVRDHQFSYWDSQLWATAKVHGVGTIYSEDFNSGATIGGVEFVNPFDR